LVTRGIVVGAVFVVIVAVKSHSGAIRHCKEITCASCLSFFRRATLQSLAEPTGSPTFCALPGEKNPAQLPQVI
jgi:hypothetical protein